MGLLEEKQPGDGAIKLSRLGFGAAPIGNLYRATSDEAAQNAIFSALDAGINYFDTAPYYGFGLSEKRLGSALQAHAQGSEAFISSKVGRCLRPIDNADTSVRYGFASDEPQEPYFDYSYDGIMRSFESSLRRLAREKINILFAHDLGEVTHGDSNPQMFKHFFDGGYRAMLELKQQGLIDAIGIGVNECEVCVDIINEVDLDCILLAGRYTLLDQSAAHEVFPLCTQRNISVILGGPFNSGILATGVRENAGPHYYNYEPASAAVLQRVERLEIVCKTHAVELAAAALQFPLLSQQVECVLAGLADKDQVAHAVTLIKQKIPHEFWVQLQNEGLLDQGISLAQGAA